MLKAGWNVHEYGASLKRGVVSGHKTMFTKQKGTTHEKMFLPSNDDVPSTIILYTESGSQCTVYLEVILDIIFDSKCCVKSNSQEYRKSLGPNSCKSLEIQFECDACGKLLNSKPRLQRHMKIHIGERSFKCTECVQTFKTLWDLTEHQKTHSKRKVTYRQRTSLVQPRKTRTKEKACKCEACGKASSRVSSYSKHKKIHRRRKPMSECVASPSNRTQPSAHIKSLTRSRSRTSAKTVQSRSFASLLL